MKWNFQLNEEKALGLFFDLDFISWTDFVLSKQFALVHMALGVFTTITDEMYMSPSHSPCITVLENKEIMN